MTVIAYDPKTRTIACDSLFNDDSRKFYADKFRVVGNKVLFFAGDQRMGHRGMDLLEAKQPLPLSVLEACTLVVFDTRYGTCFEYDDTPKARKVRRIQAWGTGSELALGALAAGASAEYAAQVACTHHIKCGGKIRVFGRRDANSTRAGT